PELLLESRHRHQDAAADLYCWNIARPGGVIRRRPADLQNLCGLRNPYREAGAPILPRLRRRQIRCFSRHLVTPLVRIQRARYVSDGLRTRNGVLYGWNTAHALSTRWENDAMMKKRKIGAPPKRNPRPGERFTIATRVQRDLKLRLDAAAEASGRSQAQ